MTIHYCDGCGGVVANPTDRVRRTFGRIEVEVMCAVDGVWNGGAVCDACVLLAVTRGKPVPEFHATPRKPGVEPYEILFA